MNTGSIVLDKPTNKIRTGSMDFTRELESPIFDETVLAVLNGTAKTDEEGVLAGVTVERLAVIGIMPPSKVPYFEKLVAPDVTPIMGTVKEPPVRKERPPVDPQFEVTVISPIPDSYAEMTVDMIALIRNNMKPGDRDPEWGVYGVDWEWYDGTEIKECTE